MRDVSPYIGVNVKFSFKDKNFFGKNNNFVKNFIDYASIHKRTCKEI